jgi:hypothetical protein
MSKEKSLKVTGVNASTVAAFEGTFASIIGLGVAILFSMQATVELANSTQSVLRGFAFGLSAGIVSIIVLPLIYFGIGWIIGYIHGWIINIVLKNAGGVKFDIEE